MLTPMCCMASTYILMEFPVPDQYLDHELTFGWKEWQGLKGDGVIPV